MRDIDALNAPDRLVHAQSLLQALKRPGRIDISDLGFGLPARCPVRAIVEFLNGALWTYEQSSFLAHGTAQDGNEADQPIWLTAEDDKPNDAQILILTDGVTAVDMEGFERCLEMFDGRDQAAVEAARARWRDYSASGHSLTYWQQNERGGWEQKAAD